MATHDSIDAVGDRLGEILQKISEIAQKSAGGGYIFRGENACYPEVSSGLYREYKDLAVDDLRIDFIQQDLVRDAKRFTSEVDDLEILNQLQHFGYQTNLIDFTTDYLIALFFSCDGQFGEDGRVSLVRRESVPTRVPKSPANRVVAQKSVFVMPPTGIVEPDSVVPIPADLKQIVLGYLQDCHGISTETIYNDLYGFIRQRTVHQSYYAEFCKALAYHQVYDYPTAIYHYTRSIELGPLVYINFVNRGDAYTQVGEYDLAIQDLDKAIELNPNEPAAYHNRGNTHGRKGDIERAIADFSRAIELNPGHAKAHLNRGVAHAQRGDIDDAIRDYDRAIELVPSEVSAYCHRGLAYGQQGEIERAITDFADAIKLDPSCAEAYCNRGNARLIKGELVLGIQDCTAAIGLEPNNAIAYFNRGVGKLFLALYGEAERDLRAAQDLAYDVVASFHREHGAIADVEAKRAIRVPAEIAVILAPSIG